MISKYSLIIFISIIIKKQRNNESQRNIIQTLRRESITYQTKLLTSDYIEQFYVMFENDYKNNNGTKEFTISYYQTFTSSIRIEQQPYELNYNYLFCICYI